MALGDLPIERSLGTLEDEITTLAAQLTSATHRLLVLIGEYDRRAGWSGFGMKSCAHWLSWKCGLGLVAAREKVRVARALQALPAISEAMRTGSVSYSKVRDMTRVATPANEHALLAVARNGTATHVEKVARLYKRTSRALEPDVAVAQHRDRELSCYWDEDGCLVIKGRLPAEQGALVMKALQVSDEALRRDERGAAGEDASAGAHAAAQNVAEQAQRMGEDASAGASWPARHADALVLMAETLLAGGARELAAGDRHLVTVHVDVNALAKEPASQKDASAEACCHVHDGPAVAREVARRFACDASVVALIENARGEVLDVGRKTRAIPPALRRALEHRDHGCRFPGCTCTRFVDAHHVEHWADGGATKLDNLVLLCRRHHRLVHEGGFALVLMHGEVSVRRPNGEALVHAPQVSALRAAGERSIAAQQRASGLAIDAHTGVPGWDGARADYDYLVAMLSDRDHAAATQAGH